MAHIPYASLTALVKRHHTLEKEEADTMNEKCRRGHDSTQRKVFTEHAAALTADLTACETGACHIWPQLAQQGGCEGSPCLVF